MIGVLKWRTPSDTKKNFFLSNSRNLVNIRNAMGLLKTHYNVSFTNTCATEHTNRSSYQEEYQGALSSITSIPYAGTPWLFQIVARLLTPVLT